MTDLITKFFTKFLPLSHRLAHYFDLYVAKVRGEFHNDWEINGEKYCLERLIPKSNIIFDVGANVGDWSTDILKIKPTAQIFCFEPFPNVFELLETNLGDKVKKFSIALCDKNGELEFYAFGGTSRLGSLYDREGIPERKDQYKIKVKAQKLDDFCKENNIDHIDYLKIDVEGADVDVLIGARELFAGKKVKFAQVEYSTGYINSKKLLKDVFDFADTTSYHVYHITSNQLRHYPEYDSKLENFRLKNFILSSELL